MADLIHIQDETGETRALMPEHNQYITAAAWPVFGETSNSPPLIPRAEWKPVSIAPLAPQIFNQGQQGRCNSEATCKTMEIAYGVAGLPVPHLSRGYLYGNINGQQDQGSSLQDAIRWATSQGICLASVVPDDNWRKSQWPATAATAAQAYKALEWWACPTFDHLASAIMRGFAVNVGIKWYEGDRVDAAGWLSNSGQGYAGGHAIARDELAFRNGEWGVGGPNSWGTAWGAKGRFVLSEKRMKAEQGPWGWFAVRAVTYTGGGAVPSINSPTL